MIFIYEKKTALMYKSRDSFLVYQNLFGRLKEYLSN